MPCTKAELVEAINSYAAARCTNDGPLIQMAAARLGQVVESLEYAPEPEPETEDDGGQE